MTAATGNSITVTFSGSSHLAIGSLTAVVTTNGAVERGRGPGGLGIAGRNASTASLPITSTAITITGAGFDTTAANNTVVFNDGAVGTVTSATATSLTVSFGTKPTAAGSLTAVVTTDGTSSGSAVQVATVSPVVTASTTSQAGNVNTVTINGTGFNPTAASNTVVFNSGAVGTVTGGGATSLTVTFSTKPAAGALTAIVTSFGASSGSAIQVATVSPFVTASTSNLTIASATTITINGFGFDPTAAHNTVTFNHGAVGKVTSATGTTLTISFTTKPTSTGALTATITTNGVTSGVGVQVATAYSGRRFAIRIAAIANW